MMNKILMPMLDGGIVNWEDDREYIPGCPTCDYGSEYINDITITMTKIKIRVVLNQMYEHALSEGDLMRLILPAYEKVKSMTEYGFTAWFKKNLLSMMQKNDCYVYDDEKIIREYTVQRLDGGGEQNDLIRRGDLYEKLQRIPLDGEERDTIMRIINMVLEAPAVDAVPVVLAMWLTNSDVPDTLICSNCGRRFDMYFFDQKDMPYCLCGAKMDGGVVDG